MSDSRLDQSARYSVGILVTAALLGRNGRGVALTWNRTNDLQTLAEVDDGGGSFVVVHPDALLSCESSQGCC